MKKILLVAVSILVFAWFATPLFAQDNSQKRQVVLEKGEIVNKDYFASGDSVTISGTVNGDAYVAGGTILVDGTINGDLLAAGGTITIHGPVTHNIRVAGGTITISSPVGGNITAGGGNIQISEVAKVTGSLVAGGGNLDIAGPIGRGMTVGAGTLRISNTVGGDVLAGTEQLSLGNGARISGNLNYWSKNTLTRATDATVAGQLMQHAPPKQFAEVKPKPVTPTLLAGLGGFLVLFKLIELAGVAIFGAILIRFAPNFLGRVTKTTEAEPWKALLVGFVTIAAAPILVIVLFVTVIGAPIALFTLALLGIVFFFTKIAAAAFIGSKTLELLKKKGNAYGAFLLGLFIITIVRFIPILGWVVAGIAYLMALGGLILAKAKLYSLLREKEFI